MSRRMKLAGQSAADEHLQLESIAKISNLQYIEVLQSYGNPIY